MVRLIHLGLLFQLGLEVLHAGSDELQHSPFVIDVREILLLLQWDRVAVSSRVDRRDALVSAVKNAGQLLVAGRLHGHIHRRLAVVFVEHVQRAAHTSDLRLGSVHLPEFLARQLGLVLQEARCVGPLSFLELVDL